MIALVLAAAVLPTEADLAQALGQLRRSAPPHVTNLHCAPSTPGYVRCTYLESTPNGYGRWAVLVSGQEGRWTVSEGPIRERAKSVRRSR